MHPDNPFEKEYNFNGLIQSHPKLSEFIIVGKSDRKSIDFGDSKAIIALNTALLKRTFDVNWELKPGHLCPALPGRLDYLIHVKDLLGAPSEKPITMRIGCLPWLPDSIFQRQLKYGVASKLA